eukprot:TRINITY_DN38851_c0_g1_i1.p1 TRINITY_DN38851_c0_g1~~TRINITY_DN38851_c0_g1_i1.p1  ORF type:complete len:239 (-),score=28.62 TRINITY_DN38851_c0_g1_i1:52-768(-)
MAEDDEDWTRRSLQFFASADRPPVDITLRENVTESSAFRLWRGSHVLCCHLSQNSAGPSPLVGPGCKVLELGSGTGLAGILCAHLGSDATLTDFDDVLATTKSNIDLNPLPRGSPGSMRVQELRWGTDLGDTFKRGQFDLIIGAEITYCNKVEQLLPTLLHLAGEHTRIVFVHVHRLRGDVEQLFARLESHFNIQVIDHEKEPWMDTLQGACTMNDTELSAKEFRCTLFHMKLNAFAV